MIDATYRTLCTTQPPELREPLIELPATLHLCPDGACSWQAYVQIPLLHTLPQFVAERTCLPPAALDRFIRAHWCAGFWGLTHDRIGDGQARPHARLHELPPVLLSWWVEHLDLALRSSPSPPASPEPPAAARPLARTAASRAARALLAERRFLAGSTPDTPLDPSAAQAYAHLVLDKVSWLSTTTFAMLHLHASPTVAARFMDTFDWILLGMQCRDDALDVLEDRRLHGRSFPERLGVTAADLLGCAQVLLRMAVSRARAADLPTIADWLGEHVLRPVVADVEGSPLLASFGAPILAAELQHHIAAHARATADDYSSCLSPRSSTSPSPSS